LASEVDLDIALSPNGKRAAARVLRAVVVFLYAPIAILVVFSFNEVGGAELSRSRGFTLRWYRQFLANGDLLGGARDERGRGGVLEHRRRDPGILASIALVRRRFPGKSPVSAPSSSARW
jgi:ABC-type spermidine/putrescine transport system permease subunit II